VEYEAPKVIIQRIKELEQQILDALNDIEGMV
jgi:type I restriction enzyme M protein